ncbi:MAG: c-type cytochrome [Gammaproteobacteria bacterium]|nr:c-type cytochrome [Gammaproteobacteria bacterium]
MIYRIIILVVSVLLCGHLKAVDYEYKTITAPRVLTTEQADKAAENYQKYCALCHGKDREGYANDHAPSLKSKQLLQSGVPHSILRPLSYGRVGTAMAGYLDEVGGPLTMDETWDLTYWLFWQESYDRLQFTEQPVIGNITKGTELYAKHCIECHGKNGEGVNAPALTNPSALAHNKDEFLRFTIREGRDGTPMQAWKNLLTSAEVDNLTAFLRSKADSWDDGKTVLRAMPTKDQYILNPDSEDPNFELKDNKYVMAADLHAALRAGKRLMLMDTRVPSVWQRAHIKGAIPMPYYTDVDDIVSELPKDVAIVAYCSCPRAAADYLVNQLRDRGFKNAITLYEGIFGWMNFGFPVMRAEGLENNMTSQH